MKIDASKLRVLAKSRGLTNTKLAAQAGITRQALQAMFRNGHVVEVRESTMKGLAQALRLSDEKLLSPDPLAGYKDALAEEHGDLTFRGLGLPTTEPRSMDAVYVPVRAVRIPDRERDEDCQAETVGAEHRPIEASDQFTVGDCLTLPDRTLLCGEPGSGKTTALRYAARANALGIVGDDRSLNPSCLPLLVRLADYARALERDTEISLVRYVVTHTLRDASPDYWVHVERLIKDELERGDCLVLLDGLDEVGGDRNLSIELRQFVEDFGKNRFVLTSRIVGLDAGPWRNLGFSTLQVAPWRDKEIREFAQRWYTGRPVAGRKSPKKLMDGRSDEFADVILNHPSLLEIASNPLMLTILAALHYANASLPRRRIGLYAKIVEVMLETWEASKRDTRPGDPLYGIVLEAREFAWLLDHLALGMQREGRILRPRWWVYEFVQQFLRDQMGLDGEQVTEQSERVVRYLCVRTGLLVERGDGVFGFSHRTFQEYFAARGLLLEVDGGGDIVAMLRPFLYHPQWEEVVVYVAASLAVQRAKTLLRVILEDPDPAGRFLRRGQRLALRCLVDGAAVADRALLDQIFSNGTVVGGSRWLGITLGFTRLLKQLLVTRYQAEAQRMLGEIEEAAKTELPDSGYFVVYSSFHEPPNGPKDDIPGKVCRRNVGGRFVELFWPAWGKQSKDPDAWDSEVLKRVRDPKIDVPTRVALISLLGKKSVSKAKVQQTLKGLLENDSRPDIRAQCAGALEKAASADTKIVKLLLDRLDKDSSDVVRWQCARALRGIAPNQNEVRLRLEKLFATGPVLVRAGAARGLSRLDLTSPDRAALRARFLSTIASPSAPVGVRFASVCVVASLLGKEGMAEVDRRVEQSLDDQQPRVRTAALHALADAITEGRKEWSPPLVEKLETMLMAVPDPCIHLFGDLTLIVAMKEIRGGQRLERLLSNALTPLGDLISIAFVFGSVARVEQVQESDVDLMILGDVRLKDLSAALHSAEQTLGRSVNPVLFSRAKFREQYREGNPFVLDVVRKEKIFLKGDRDELTELVADRSSE